MRQAWINNLREKVAEIASCAPYYWNKGGPNLEFRRDEEQKRLTQLEHEIELLINPSEADHRELVDTIRKMMWALEVRIERPNQFAESRQKAIILGQRIFKAEWNRIKQEIEKP